MFPTLFSEHSLTKTKAHCFSSRLATQESLEPVYLCSPTRGLKAHMGELSICTQAPLLSQQELPLTKLCPQHSYTFWHTTTMSVASAALKAAVPATRKADKETPKPSQRNRPRLGLWDDSETSWIVLPHCPCRFHAATAANIRMQVGTEPGLEPYYIIFSHLQHDIKLIFKPGNGGAGL